MLNQKRYEKKFTFVIMLVLFVIFSNQKIYATDVSDAVFTITSSEVVINEIWQGNDDRVELYNKGTGSVDLTGWQVISRRDDGAYETTWTLPSFILDAGAYVLLHEIDESNTTTDLYFNNSVAWAHADTGSCALVDEAGNGVDFVRWGGSTTSPPAGTSWSGPEPVSPFNPLSLGRDELSTDTDTGSDFTAQNLTDGGVNEFGPAFCRTNLADGAAGQSYSDAVLAMGGEGPLRYTHFSGALPPGLSFEADGVLSGTPSNTGGYSFMVIVSDSDTPTPNTSEATCNVWINAYPRDLADHDNNNTLSTVFNNSTFGSSNGPDPDEGDKGFQFNGENGLYDGNLVIAQAEDQVSGRLFFGSQEFNIQSPVDPIASYLTGFAQVYQASFNDERAPNPIGISVVQKSNTKPTSPDDDYVILDYEIINNSGSDLTGIYVGLVMDWDVGDASTNLGGYDGSRKLSYMYETDVSPSSNSIHFEDPERFGIVKKVSGTNGTKEVTNPNYYGVSVLLGEASGHTIWQSRNYSDNDDFYYVCMTTFNDIPTEPWDMFAILSAGPYDIPAGNSVRVVFAVLGGTDLTDLQANAEAAASAINQPLSSVTFQVDMSNELPNIGPGEIIGLRGNTPPLSWTESTPMTENDNGIYQVDVDFSAILPGTEIEYKFVHHEPPLDNNSSVTWEGDVGTGDSENRVIILTGGHQTLPVVFWNYSNTGSAYIGRIHASGIRVYDANPVNPDADPSAYIITGNTITVEAWIFPMSLPGHQNEYGIVDRPYLNEEPWTAYKLSIWNKGDSDEPRIMFGLTDGDVPENGGYVFDLNPTVVGSWTHIAGTYDGSMMRLYINGELVAYHPYASNIGAGNTGFYIGGRWSQYSNLFHGIIDEVRLWNVARSPAEILTAKHFDHVKSEPGLVGYWPLKEAVEVNGCYPVTVDMTTNHNDLWANITQFVDFVPGDDVIIGPEITSGSFTGTIGQEFTYRPGAGGWPIADVSYVSGPAGMSWDDGTGTVIWTPASGQEEYHDFILEATNIAGTVQETYTIWVNPYPTDLADHNNNNTISSVLNNSTFGNYGGAGQGFQFNGQNGLYTANIVIAQAEDQVSGRLYGGESEFGITSLVDPGVPYLPGFDQVYESHYFDGRAPNPIGVSVRQRSSTKSTAPDDDYVILDYEITNTSGSALTGIYVGLSADLDVGSFSANLGGYDGSRKLSYMYETDVSPSSNSIHFEDPERFGIVKKVSGTNGTKEVTNPNYYGVSVLLGEASGHTIWQSRNYSDNDDFYYVCMTTFNDIPTEPWDMISIISAGPYNIQAGGTVRAAFAVLGGTDLADLQANADAAILAIGGDVVTATVGCSNICEGNQIVVPIDIDMSGVDSPNEKLGSYTGTLNWDQTLLEYVGYTGGTTSGWGSPTVNESDVSNGHLSFGHANASGTAGSINIINVTFNVIGSVGQNGIIDLGFSAMASAISFVDLIPFLTIEDCNYTIDPCGILGDVNGDEIANSTDALIVLSCDVGINTSQFCPMNCGDVNDDGFINSTDALIILSYDVGIPVPFPVGEPGCPQDVTPCPGCIE